MPETLNNRLQSPYIPSGFYTKHDISIILTALNIQSPTKLFRLYKS